MVSIERCFVLAVRSEHASMAIPCRNAHQIKESLLSQALNSHCSPQSRPRTLPSPPPIRTRSLQNRVVGKLQPTCEVTAVAGSLARVVPPTASPSTSRTQQARRSTRRAFATSCESPPVTRDTLSGLRNERGSAQAHAHERDQMATALGSVAQHLFCTESGVSTTAYACPQSEPAMPLHPPRGVAAGKGVGTSRPRAPCGYRTSPALVPPAPRASPPKHAGVNQHIMSKTPPVGRSPTARHDSPPGPTCTSRATALALRCSNESGRLLDASLEHVCSARL